MERCYSWFICLVLCLQELSHLSRARIFPTEAHFSTHKVVIFLPLIQTFWYFNVHNLIQWSIFQTGIGKCAGDTVYSLKDWCEINNQQQQQQFHHQALHQKGGWNNFGPIADWTSIDPAIVTSSRPLPFQTTSTWQFPHIHPSHPVTHNAQQVQSL